MKQVPYSSRTADKFVVRLPEGMREKLAEVARNRHRSMNSEIISRLSASLESDGEGVAVEVNEETPRRTVTWCPGVGETVIHDDYGIGVISRLYVENGKLWADIKFEHTEAEIALEANGPVRPFLIEV